MANTAEHRSRHRLAFTLVELLVVIAIIGLLISFLFPAIHKARQAALNTDCASQLRQLATACEMYLGEQHVYPEPLFIPALNGCVPSTVQPRLLNELAPCLGWPAIQPTDLTTNLPRVSVCPYRSQIDLFQQPDNSVGTTYWITGYMYCGRLDDVENTGGTVINPDHIAHARGRTRGVLWADTLLYSAAGTQAIGYSYFHYSGGLSFNPTFGTLNNCSQWTCRHRAWGDGSVEEINSSGVNLSAGLASTRASYKVAIPGAYDVYCYF